METTEGKFEGLTITLKKRKLNISAEKPESVKNIPEEDYLVLGHYDQIAIKYISDWWEWTPDRTEGISLDDVFVDKYSIKAYFPENGWRKKHQKKGYDYDIWKGTENETPFVIVSVINISEEYAREILKSKKHDVCDAFSDVVTSCVEEAGIKDRWEQMHCALLPTIGFSDFLLVFKTADLNSTLNLLERLKEILIDGAPCLSNAYTMIGFRDRGLDKLQAESVGGIKLAIRFGLRDGISARQFKTYFEKVFEDRENGQNAAGIEKNYRVLGDADFLIVSNIELQQVLPRYFYREKPGLFHPAHDLFRYYIRSMQSEVRVEAPRGAADLSNIEKIRKEKNVDYVIEEYQSIIHRLEDFMNDNRIPERVVYGLQIVMKRFLQLVQSGHCFDMEYIIGGAFRNLIICLEQSMDIIAKKKSAGEYEEIDEIGQMCSALNTFRDKIGDYLADMQRSDSLFLEGRSLSHPSIGSATKLLFFYNGYIDMVKSVLCAEGENDRYQFVVTSGGTDQTRATDLFSHLDPSGEEAHSIILLSVPEASLYDVKSSLFHVLHEMLHFCGERKRRERLGFVIDAVCAYTAAAFGDFLEKDQEYLYYKTLAPLKPYLSSETIKSIKEAINDKTNEIKDKIEKLIKDRLAAEIPESWKEKDYFGRKVYRKLYIIMEEKIFELQEKDRKTEQLLYDIFWSYQYALAERIEKILQDSKIPYSNVNHFCPRLKMIRESDANGENADFAKQDKKNIRDIIELYFGKDVGRSGAGKDTRDDTDESSIVIGEEDADFDLDQILMNLKQLCEECYADCMAGRILDLSTEHFIFSFLTETRNERDAFPAVSLSKLRMIIDLKYLYGIENGLSEDVRKRLMQHAEKVQKTGMKHIKTDDLADWLEKIISTEGQKEKIEALTIPVIAYLEQCEREWEKQKLFEQLGGIQKINEYSDMETAENTYGFLESVADKWTGYAR